MYQLMILLHLQRVLIPELLLIIWKSLKRVLKMEFNYLQSISPWRSNKDVQTFRRTHLVQGSRQCIKIIKKVSHIKVLTIGDLIIQQEPYIAERLDADGKITKYGPGSEEAITKCQTYNPLQKL